MKPIARQVIFYGVIFGLWSLICKLHIWPPYVLPAPWAIVEALWAGFQDHSFPIAILASMRRMLIGYGISVVLGTFLGIVLASNRFFEQTVSGLLVSLQSLPSICWLPLAVLWFGLSENAILFVIVMGSLLSVTISMETGRKQMPKIYSMAGPQPGRAQVEFVLSRAATGQHALHCYWAETRLGLRMALLVCWRNDLRHTRVGPATQCRPRSQRHEPGHRCDDFDHCHRYHGRPPAFSYDRKATPDEMGSAIGHLEVIWSDIST